MRLHDPQPAGVAIRFDKPWEGAFSAYITVLHDAGKYRMYYRGLPSAGKDGTNNEVTCYAESDDGIQWIKPNLGLYEIQGSHENNVLLAGEAPSSHNFCPFVDKNPRALPEQRYKALAGTGKRGLVAYASPDGIRFKRMQDEAVITQGAFDSQNVSFWSESEGCYVAYFRTWDGVRSVSRATSEDFVHWTDPVAMTYGDTRREHLYTNQTQPYFRAPHIYLGVAARFMPGRQVLTTEQAKQIGVDPKYFGDCSEAVLLTTRGGNSYSRRFMEAFVRPGIGLENWVSRTNYPAYGILPDGSDKISLYIHKNYGQPTSRLDRYTLRTDGFASAHGPYQGGELITKPLTFGAASGTNNPRELVLNVSTSAAGSVRVELQDAEGHALPGFALADCREIIGDQIERPVVWRDSSNVNRLAGRSVRIRLKLTDADVYSFRFR